MLAKRRMRYPERKSLNTLLIKHKQAPHTKHMSMCAHGYTVPPFTPYNIEHRSKQQQVPGEGGVPWSEDTVRREEAERDPEKEHPRLPAHQFTQTGGSVLSPSHHSVTSAVACTGASGCPLQPHPCCPSSLSTLCVPGEECEPIRGGTAFHPWGGRPHPDSPSQPDSPGGGPGDP